MEDEGKNLNNLKFTGKKDDYVMWQAKFISFATYKGFKDHLLGTSKLIVAADGNVLTDAQNKTNINWLNKNAMAYSFLHLCIKDPVSFGAIYNAVTDQLPDGDASVAWNNMMLIFKPVSSAKKHELEQAFNQSNLRSENKNPDEWFAELEKIRLQLKLDFQVKLDDDKMISQIVYNLHPTPYQTTVALLKRDLNKAVVLTLSDVKDDIRQIYGSLKVSHQTSAETALTGKSRFKKQYKGQCRICGRRHKADDCWELEKNKSKRPANYKPRTTSTEKANISVPYKGPPCDYCQMTNHPTEKCWRKKKGLPPITKEQAALHKADKNKPNPKAETMMIAVTKAEVDYLLSSASGPSSLTKNTFIADSGASCHMRNSTLGMYDLEDHIQEVTVGNSETMLSKYKGKFKGTIIQQDGGYMPIVLSEVLFVPDLWLNLISITKVLKQPHINMRNTGQLITIIFEAEDEHPQEQFTFDKIHPAGSGQLLGVEIIPSEDYANMVMLTEVLVIYENLHEKLGHPNETVVTNTANHYGINVKNQPHKCKYCIMGKHRKMNIPKEIKNRSQFRGERINIDISSVAATSYGGAKYWLLIQDDYTDFLWSYFLKEKSQLPDIMLQWINQIQKETKITVHKVRCDNSGENRKLQKLLQQHFYLDARFEYTAPYTPQQNGKIERKFATLYGKIRSMLNWARLSPLFKKRLWAQCANTATQLENIIVKANNTKTSYELFYGVNPEWTKFLRTFGEIAMVQDGQLGQIKGKLTNRGMPCMFIGYPEDHAPNVYQFLKLGKASLILSRNAIWLNQSYGEYMNLELRYVTVTPPADIDWSEDLVHIFGDQEEDNDEEEYALVEPADEEEEEEEEEEDQPPHPQPDEESSEEDTDHEDQPKQRIKGVHRELRNLEGFFNEDPYEFLDQETANLTQEKDYVMVANIHDGNPEPKSYYEARQCKDWSKWKTAMYTEFKNMEEKGVWKVHKRTDLPAGRKLIGNRWVYNLKDDGRYRARTVAKGFSQIPGKDFQENFAPVIIDTSLHIMLVLLAMNLLELKTEQFDIETAFLYGDLEEEIWMILPEGYPDFVREVYGLPIHTTTHCVKLLKALYGLVQAARQWWMKFKSVLSGIGYHPSGMDPCLFMKNKPDKTKSFVTIYVDDGIVFGTEQDIKETMSALNKSFKVKSLGPLQHFVGCHIIQPTSHPNTLYIHQPKLLKHLQEDFGSQANQVKKVYKTPAGPKTVIMRPQKGDPLISSSDQTVYRSGVGMLLYLVKHSRPEISNAVRELSKVGDGATKAHWKDLMRTIKYVLDTQDLGLKISPTMEKDKLTLHGKVGSETPFTLEGIVDSEYAGDRDSRISVYGYVIYLCNAPISWKSKSGNSVTLSSTEAEYYAISEVAKELLFAKQLLESMGYEVLLPIKIKTDNVGAIYLANNYTTSQRTKHIDVRTHFVRQHIESGTFIIEFVKSVENDADIFTKNTSEDIFNTHSTKLVNHVDNK